MRRATGLDAATADRLQELEVRIEHDECIPLVENLTLVRDGDVLVSDAYLPPAVIRSLLSHVGLDRQAALVVGNDGKHTGRVWPDLLRRVAVARHLSDNSHSNGRTPAAAASIPTALFHGAARTPVERHLTERGWRPLADLARAARLANPFPPARAAQRHLWALAAQLNFPLLVLASLLLERHAAATGAGELLFVSRDGLMWQPLHRALFPHRPGRYLYASRRCLLRPSESFREYFASVWRPESVVVDLTSTGTSWAHFFARQGARARCFFIALIDDHRYLPGAAPTADQLDMAHVLRTSAAGFSVTKGLEMLNYAAHGSVEDVRLLPGGAALPVLAEVLEYDPELPRAADAAFATALGSLDRRPELRREPDGSVADLVLTLGRVW